MPKVDWANLEIIEEGPNIDPGDSMAVFRKNEQARQLAQLVLEIYFAVKKSKWKRKPDRGQDEE